MDKEIPVPKKINKKVISLHKTKKPNKQKEDILKPSSNDKDLIILHESIFKKGITCVGTGHPSIIVGLRGVIKEMRHHYPNAVTGDKYPILKTKVTEVFIIELLEKPSYIDCKDGRERWSTELTTNQEWNDRRQVWESLGVNYIVDYNISKILSEIVETK